MTWFGIQTDAYRRQWLRYAWDWVRKNDPNGYVEMPGMRGMAANPMNRRCYYANNPSPAVPDGFCDEATIRAIWESDSETR